MEDRHQQQEDAGLCRVVADRHRAHLPGAGQDVQVPEGVLGARHAGAVVAARDEEDVVAADRHRDVPALGEVVRAVEAEAAVALDAEEVDLLELGLDAARGVVVLVRRVARPRPGGRQHLAAEEAVGRVDVTVQPVNDPPSFTKGTNQTTTEDGDMVSLAWATNILPGPPDEVGQTVEFLVEVCDPCEAARYAYRIDGVVVSDVPARSKLFTLSWKPSTP